jgi:hypothetical protein
MIDLVWLLVGLLLTLLIFSYLFGDNPLFRIGSYIFIGAAAGYAAVIIIYQVLLPRLYMPLVNGDLLSIVPLGLGILLLSKLFPRLSRLGSVSMAYLVGSGAAIIIGGAVIGTLIGQVKGAASLFDIKNGNVMAVLMVILQGGFMLFGTICTLAYFQFSATAKNNQSVRRWPVVEGLSKVGQIFIAITLGSLFAGVLISTLVILIERIDFIKSAILSILSSF